MAVIKRVDLERVGHQALVLNLGDIAAHGERQVAAARAEATAIVAAAKAERERLIADARRLGHEEGRKAGHAEGVARGRTEGHAAALAEGRERHQAIEASWAKGLDAFLAERDAMLDAAKLDLLKLAIAATQRITKRRLEVDPTLVADQMAAAIAEAARGTGLVVRVAPEDLEFARQALPGIVRRLGGGVGAEVREDAALTRGSCVVSMAGGGVVDASIRTQMKRVAEALLPGEEAPGGDVPRGLDPGGTP
jgi:flagellar biosynthesis/type III secretory pathway protein FliH